jgi:hypothetical protein
MEVIDPGRSVSRQQPEPTAEKDFPVEAVLNVTLSFAAGDMEKVRVWYGKTRLELGDKFMADFAVPRLIFEAFAGGAVNPQVLRVEESVHA